MSACAQPTPQLRTVTEPPRIEKIELTGDMAQPCPRAAEVLPDPAGPVVRRTMTELVAELTGRLEQCADRHDAVLQTVKSEAP